MGPARRLAAGLLVVAAALPHSTGAEMTIDRTRVGWTRLDFAASKLGLTTTSVVERRTLPAAEVGPHLVDPGGGVHGLEPSGTVERIVVSSSFLGRRARDVVLFSPGDMKTLQRAVVETGKRRRYKVVRYAEEGIVVRRGAPATASEASLEPSRWSDATQELIRHPPGVDVVQEPAILLYLFSALDLEPGHSRFLTVFADGEIHRARFESDGLRQVPVTFDVVTEKGFTRIEGPRTLRRVIVSPERVGDREGKLELLGLQGEIEAFVDLEHGVPVLIRGKVRIAGEVEIRLRRVHGP